VKQEDIISSGLLEMYALGHTNAEENEYVLTLLNQHPDLKAELTEIEIALESYAMSNAVNPHAKLKTNLFNTLNITDKAVSKNAPKVVKFNYAKLAAAAAILLLLASVALNVLFYNKIKNTNNILATTQQQISEINDEMKIVQSKFSLPLKMNGSELAPDADAKIFWLTNTGEIFIDPRNLPPTPKGKQYQLWAIVDGKAIDGGLIKSEDGKTFKLQQMKTFGKAQAFAITLEVEGGVEASKEKPFAIVKL
jgi:anti-sigma-K factor RskA